MLECSSHTTHHTSHTTYHTSHTTHHTQHITHYTPQMCYFTYRRYHWNTFIIAKRTNVRLEAFTAVTMKNGVFWNVTPFGSCKNWGFGGTKRLLHQGDKNRWTRNKAVNSNRRTLLSSSETSVLTRATLRNIPEDAILHSHRRENLKSYICSAVIRSLEEHEFQHLW
jgi:hypothetical protein